jgi:hypothetical protein
LKKQQHRGNQYRNGPFHPTCYLRKIRPQFLIMWGNSRFHESCVKRKCCSLTIKNHL